MEEIVTFMDHSPEDPSAQKLTTAQHRRKLTPPPPETYEVTHNSSQHKFKSSQAKLVQCCSDVALQTWNCLKLPSHDLLGSNIDSHKSSAISREQIQDKGKLSAQARTDFSLAACPKNIGSKILGAHI